MTGWRIKEAHTLQAHFFIESWYQSWYQKRANSNIFGCIMKPHNHITNPATIYFRLFEIQYLEEAATYRVKQYWLNFTKSRNKGNSEGTHSPINLWKRSLKIALKRTFSQVYFQGFVKFD